MSGAARGAVGRRATVAAATASKLECRCRILGVTWAAREARRQCWER